MEQGSPMELKPLAELIHIKYSKFEDLIWFERHCLVQILKLEQKYLIIDFPKLFIVQGDFLVLLV